MTHNVNIVVQTPQDTVIAEYIPAGSRSDSYQSEAALEAEFIRLLSVQGYEPIAITTEDALVKNLRHQLEMLNAMTFTDAEWEGFYSKHLANTNEDLRDKTHKIQNDPIQSFTRADGSLCNVKLIDKKHIHNNRLQVIHQYENDSGTYKNRYDVTILVNGLPLVHVELKRRGVAIREAFNQIQRYQRDSFGAGRACLNMCKSLSFPTAPIPNITAIPRANCPLRTRGATSRAPKRLAIPLSLLPTGQTRSTARSPIWWTSRKHSSPSTRC
ncbi:MAG UNVERIFIED_CONTAM: hypothetical protein LVT10_21910 [Anaerolineae bacterium]|jgi:hypothetical protein